MSVGWGLAAIALMFVLMNSLNLLDNSDGCCAMVSLCILLTAALSRWTPVTPMLLAAAAAIGGFLMTNWPPARLFMGDAGSLLLGAWCAILALMPPASAPAVKWHLVPAFWVPAYDTLSVIVLRLARGRPVWIGGQDHLAHRLRRRGLRPAWVVAVFAAATLAAGGIGLALPGPHGVLLLLGLLAVSGAAEWLFWKARRG
jgi:UDP-GlcNAc:undecaprenyl-phosphate GlcNAc-1-phosphate transferase